MAKKLFPLLLLIPLLVSCNIDHGLGLQSSGIKGKLVIRNAGQMPESIESVRIVAVINFNPEEISLSDVVISLRPVNLNQAEPEYYIPAPLGDYYLIAAIYKVKKHEWNYSNILSYYGLDLDSLKTDPLPVFLTNAQPFANNIDMVCDWSKVNVKN